MAENHKIVVIKSKTAQFRHTGHRTVTHVHASVLWTIVHFFRENSTFPWIECGKKAISYSRKPVVSQYPFL